MDDNNFELTAGLVSKVLEVVDAGLVKGVGNPRPGEMCIEAAVCFAMGLPHGDKPTCVDSTIRAYKIRLNDANWSSNKARSDGMRKLAILQLGTKTTDFDKKVFASALAIKTIQILLPAILSSVGLHNDAAACKNATTLAAARTAADNARNSANKTANAYAADAAAYAADAAAAAYAADAAAAAYAAANAAAYAADAAAYAADAAAAAYAAANAAELVKGDSYLLMSAKLAEDILVEMQVPGVVYLHLLDK